MNLQGLAPIIVTEKLTESRDFYCKFFNFTVVFEAEWYVHLRGPGDARIELAFMVPDAPDQHEHLRPAFTGEGLALRFEVPDVDAECERVWSDGLELIVPVRDEAWGERHFSVLDPNGVYVDVVQPIAATDEYQDAYAEGAQAS